MTTIQILHSSSSAEPQPLSQFTLDHYHDNGIATLETAFTFSKNSDFTPVHSLLPYISNPGARTVEHRCVQASCSSFEGC